MERYIHFSFNWKYRKTCLHFNCFSVSNLDFWRSVIKSPLEIPKVTFTKLYYYYILVQGFKVTCLFTGQYNTDRCPGWDLSAAYDSMDIELFIKKITLYTRLIQYYHSCLCYRNFEPSLGWHSGRLEIKRSRVQSLPGSNETGF